MIPTRAEEYLAGVELSRDLDGRPSRHLPGACSHASCPLWAMDERLTP